MMSTSAQTSTLDRIIDLVQDDPTLNVLRTTVEELARNLSALTTAPISAQSIENLESFCDGDLIDDDTITDPSHHVLGALTCHQDPVTAKLAYDCWIKHNNVPPCFRDLLNNVFPRIGLPPHQDIRTSLVNDYLKQIKTSTDNDDLQGAITMALEFAKHPENLDLAKALLEVIPDHVIYNWRQPASSSLQIYVSMVENLPPDLARYTLQKMRKLLDAMGVTDAPEGTPAIHIKENHSIALAIKRLLGKPKGLGLDFIEDQPEVATQSLQIATAATEQQLTLDVILANAQQKIHSH